MTKLDILAFGAHPDDVEIGMAGVLALYSQKGYKVGICNLTEAELSSNGTPSQRQKEASIACEVIGAAERIQLKMGDRALRFFTESDLNKIVSLIRYHQPKIVFAPYHLDRHPDHGMTTEIIKEAIFNSGIRNYQCGYDYPAHRVHEFHLYMINGYVQPDFVIDITAVMDLKIEALSAYQSQFEKQSDSVDTPLTNGYIEKVIARERLFGSEVGVSYAEGFKTTKPMLVKDLLEMSEEKR
ncbi:bacillithiol biosynthesis deacetylase BshB1 [Bacillus sp. FJAT-45037]|uniref:bacillithiol biosynthesis deacetylase BshB1 n=1 Tax=Bacillus sp. FJAT-45037 TaxID=2011007 RepID=UPI000C238332|nr:bacillithiol biosynthesis deacetylase BshB1 [Bacillus sp. FJAT-45037]